MFGKKVENIKLEGNAVDCLVSSDMRVEGDILFSGGLRIDGVVIGNVTVHEGKKGTLIISEHARVEGTINVSDAIVNGSIKGTVQATGCLQLEPSARIDGDITYKTLEMFPGAVVSGRLIHPENAAEIRADDNE
jgi:cytoskeletal protein CcmA (bactofilin family)